MVHCHGVLAVHGRAPWPLARATATHGDPKKKFAPP